MKCGCGVCKGGEKILPFGKDEPQANLQKVEIFLSHLLALAHMFCELSERMTNTI